jgi:hypothetical protein
MPYLNNFSIKPGMGYWIYVEENISITWKGKVAQPNIKLHKGYNLIGWTSLQNGDARAVYKTTDFDFREYGKLQMFVHAEKSLESQELEYGDLEVCFIHDPDLARKIARSGDFGLVCFGHTHRWHLERIRDCIFLNPGEILGKKEPAGWALLDTDSLEIEHIFLDT